MKHGVVGRADLLEAYLAGGPDLQAVVARLLGMERLAPEPVEVAREVAPAVAPIREPAPVVGAEAVSVPFWRAERYERIETPTEEGEAIPEEPLATGEPTAERPRPAPLAFRPLASHAAVLTKLRRVSSFSRISGELDVPRVVDQLSRGRFPGVLPRRWRKAWGQSIHVVVDRHEHLAPYRRDQDAVLRTIGRVYPRDGVAVADLRHGATQPHRRETSQRAAYQLPEPGTTVLVLSDLGALAVEGDAARETWSALGRRYRENGTRPIALVPCDVACVPLDVVRDWTVIPWESRVASRQAGLNPEQADEAARRVLTLLSYALRLEPILIRAVRRLLVKGGLGAGVEARVWQHAALRGRHPEAAEFDPDEAHRLQEHFEREAPELRREVIALLGQCHDEEFPAVWFLEQLALEAEAARLGLSREDLDEAIRWVRAQRDLIQGDAGKQDPCSDESLWFGRTLARGSESLMHGSAGDLLHQIWGLTRITRDPPPAGLDPGRVPALAQPLRTVELRQVGTRIVARPFAEAGHFAGTPGSPLALIRTRNGLITFHHFDDFWAGGAAPEWADEWGRDEYGAWVTLRVDGVSQRLRWIPPGTFWMGSPEDEEGRYSDEGPRHEETIPTGFWMFDTPCTQALWQAVMGENPSRFPGPDRPVERVSWEQCQEFVEHLNDRCAGLALSLPSEVHWEYACRAGTDSPRYREDLDQIAWYRENSQGETHPVGQKAPNDWGLFDTLGNVYEWCEDVWKESYQQNKKMILRDASAQRVIRGGSWLDSARNVRAAFRCGFDPSARFGYLGFRCAEFRARGPGGPEQEAERARERGAGCGAPGDRDRASGAGAINLNAEGMDGVSFATPVSVVIFTSVDYIVMSAMHRPPWASAIGRDPYGLWAEFTVERKAAVTPTKRGWRWKKASPQVAPAPLVRQRLRWIPPGRFVMGSPGDEEGRYGWEQSPHEVAIDEGFWMFDTPCTQALWDAIMPENPSRFRSPDRPVERVSWEECQSFGKRLSEKVGLALGLPSEAQWEYACRAGTTTATYAGPLKIEGFNNAPILDAIAWYGGNSGIDFELGGGHDASGWPEKQFAFDKAGTHPVARKKANPWGLYDMLGNVWEWCMGDWMSDDAEERGASSAQRAVRGGSWSHDARGVRAAYRLGLDPTGRDDDLGFRCAEFKEGKKAE